MRTEEEAKQWGVWTPVSGEWKIYSVMERIYDNPAARIREGYEPVADRSPNPFCLSAKAPQGEAIIVTGYDFWCDYEASVSIKPFLSNFGLIFGYQDEKNFNRIEWNLPTLGETPARQNRNFRNPTIVRFIITPSLVSSGRRGCVRSFRRAAE